ETDKRNAAPRAICEDGCRARALRSKRDAGVRGEAGERGGVNESLITSALKGWRFLYRRGFIEGFGHISVRLPGTDRFMVMRHSAAMDARPEDLLVFDLDGNHLE